MLRHMLLLGETGAGKTSLAKYMMPSFSRVLVLDRHWEYPRTVDTPFVKTFETVQGFEAFSFRVTRDVHEDWRISFRTDNDAEWGAAVALVYGINRALARAGEYVPTTMIVVEEIGLLSSSHKVPRWLANLWNYGRHYGITAIGICRVDTETHSVLRLNSTLVFFRSSEITAKVARGMSGDMIRGLGSLELYDWQSNEPPQHGRHYVSFPDHGDILGRLQGRNRLRVVV